MSQAPRIVVFDLDVTLTRYDTFLPFVIGYWRYQRKRRGLAIWRMPLLALLKFWRWRDRTWVKTQVLRAFLGGEPRHRIDDWVERFVTDLLKVAMREQGMAELRRHQAEGSRVVLASASFDVYVERLAERLQINEVLATRVAWNARRRLVGMDGENCRDAEKLRRVKTLLGAPPNGAGVTAYSDSHADLPLLRWVENGVAVCPSKRLFHQVGGLGLEIVRW